MIKINKDNLDAFLFNECSDDENGPIKEEELQKQQLFQEGFKMGAFIDQIDCPPNDLSITSFDNSQSDRKSLCNPATQQIEQIISNHFKESNGSHIHMQIQQQQNGNDDNMMQQKEQNQSDAESDEKEQQTRQKNNKLSQSDNIGLKHHQKTSKMVNQQLELNYSSALKSKQPRFPGGGTFANTNTTYNCCASEQDTTKTNFNQQSQMHMQMQLPPHTVITNINNVAPNNTLIVNSTVTPMKVNDNNNNKNSNNSQNQRHYRQQDWSYKHVTPTPACSTNVFPKITGMPTIDISNQSIANQLLENISSNSDNNINNNQKRNEYQQQKNIQKKEVTPYQYQNSDLESNNNGDGGQCQFDSQEMNNNNSGCIKEAYKEYFIGDKAAIRLNFQTATSQGQQMQSDLQQQRLGTFGDHSEDSDEDRAIPIPNFNDESEEEEDAALTADDLRDNSENNQVNRIIIQRQQQNIQQKQQKMKLSQKHNPLLGSTLQMRQSTQVTQSAQAQAQQLQEQQQFQQQFQYDNASESVYAQHFQEILEQNQMLSLQVQQMNGVINEQNSQMLEIQNKSTQLEHSLSQHNELLHQASLALEDKEKALTEMQKITETQQKEIFSLKEENLQIQNVKEECNNEITKARQNLNQSQIALEQSNKHLTNAKGENNVNKVQLQQKTTEIQNQNKIIHDLNAKISSIQRKLQQCDSDVERYREDSLKFQEEALQLQRQNDSIANNSAATQVQDMTRKNIELFNQNKELNERLKKTIASLRESQGKEKEYKKEVQRLKKQSGSVQQLQQSQCIKEDQEQAQIIQEQSSIAIVMDQSLLQESILQQISQQDQQVEQMKQTLLQKLLSVSTAKREQERINQRLAADNAILLNNSNLMKNQLVSFQQTINEMSQLQSTNESSNCSDFLNLNNLNSAPNQHQNTLQLEIMSSEQTLDLLETLLQRILCSAAMCRRIVANPLFHSLLNTIVCKSTTSTTTTTYSKQAAKKDRLQDARRGNLDQQSLQLPLQNPFQTNKHFCSTTLDQSPKMFNQHHYKTKRQLSTQNPIIIEQKQYSNQPTHISHKSSLIQQTGNQLMKHDLYQPFFDTFHHHHYKSQDSKSSFS